MIYTHVSSEGLRIAYTSAHPQAAKTTEPGTGPPGPE
jgi:hypothetical protein